MAKEKDKPTEPIEPVVIISPIEKRRGELQTTGSPTLYNESVITRTVKFLKNRLAQGLLPTKAGLSAYLGVSQQALYRWEQKHDGFGDLIKKMRNVSEDMLIQKGMDGSANIIMCLFCLKNHHGYSDRINMNVNHTEKKQVYEVDGKIIEF